MINACLAPVVSKYLYALVEELKKLGFKEMSWSFTPEAV